MSSFTQAPTLEAIPPEYNSYRSTRSFIYWIDEVGTGPYVEIPEDFITDGATIPKWAWSIIGGPLGRYAPAAVVHDYLLQEGIFSRKKCDEIFYKAMTILGVPYWKRKLMYLAVRLNSIWQNLRKRKKVNG